MRTLQLEEILPSADVLWSNWAKENPYKIGVCSDVDYTDESPRWVRYFVHHCSGTGMSVWEMYLFFEHIPKCPVLGKE